MNAALEGIDGVSGVTVKGGIGVYLNSQGQEVIEYTYSVEANVTEASEKAFTAAMAMVAEVSKQDSFIVNYLEETKENTKGNHGSAAQVRVKLDRPLTPTEKAQLTNMFSQLKLGVTITEDEITSSNFDKEHISNEDFYTLTTYLLDGFNNGNAETTLHNARRAQENGSLSELSGGESLLAGDGASRVWSGAIERRTNYSDYDEARNNGEEPPLKRYLDADGRETDTERYYGKYYTSADEADKGRVPQTNLTPDELRSRVQAVYDSTEEAMSSPAIDTSNTEAPNAPKPDAPKPTRKPREKKPKLTNEEKEEQSHGSYPYNPVMAEVLYRTTFLESWGSGASRIMDACKAQNVPEPTWSINGGFICVTFVRPVTDPMKTPVGLQLELRQTQAGPKLDLVTNQVRTKYEPSTNQVKDLILSVSDNYLSLGDMMRLCGLKSRMRFRTMYILPALKENAIERKYPDIPNHPRQQYRLTEQTKAWKNNRK